ncbi:MAG TPA: LysR family transcriptional regulator [Pseudonocardiaceae bacterium]|jgi:DNA-binding transcriptional LysR family regulator|nr:LysR family transcriptional regulator [Pseudonocardiaceae bacterium]
MATDVDLRKLRYFVALARHLHFGRAAEDLHIAQPALSRQIRALEQELAAKLFDRDSHGVTLTEAGRQLLDDAVPLLAAADATRRRVAAAAGGPRRLTVGFRSGIVVTPAVQVFSAGHPDVAVDVQKLEWDDQAEMLLDGRVDIAYVRQPIAERGLWVRRLYTEPRVAVLPAGHRLAGRASITEDDLADEPIVWHPNAILLPTRRKHVSSGHRVRSVEEKLEHVAAGRGVSLLPESAAAYYSRPDITYVPIPDLPGDEVCLAALAGRPAPLVSAFAKAARQVQSMVGV